MSMRINSVYVERNSLLPLLRLRLQQIQSQSDEVIPLGVVSQNVLQQILPVPANDLLSVTVDSVENKSKNGTDAHLKLIGRTILDGNLQVIDYIASGRISNVYVVSNARGKCYAAKILKEEANSNKNLERFLNEVEALVQFSDHSHILAIKALGTFDERPFIITELADGGSLYLRVQRVGLTLGKALNYLGQVCYGLNALHEKGFIHRDVKPHNIFLIKDKAKLGDFDLIKRVIDDSSELDVNSISGTINYISPEQASSKKLNFKSDIYSLGVTAFHILTGGLPFKGNVCQVINQHIDAQPVNPGDLNKDIPLEVQEIILRALSKNPESRPSALEFGECMLKLSNANLPEVDLKLIEL